jgi:threonine dehydrogenase-like Zn-dependent dehydrogenase
MNIELDEVVVMDVSDDALELAAGGAQRVYSPATMDRFWGGGVGC